MASVRALRPDRWVFDAGDAHWRGGQIASIVGATTTIRLLAEAHIVRVKTCNTSLIPVDARTIGCPLACRVTGGGAEDYVIVEVVGSTFGPAAPRDNAGSVARGEFYPGIVPRAIHGEPATWWEA